MEGRSCPCEEERTCAIWFGELWMNWFVTGNINHNCASLLRLILVSNINYEKCGRNHTMLITTHTHIFLIRFGWFDWRRICPLFACGSMARGWMILNLWDPSNQIKGSRIDQVDWTAMQFASCNPNEGLRNAFVWRGTLVRATWCFLGTFPINIQGHLKGRHLGCIPFEQTRDSINRSCCKVPLAG